MTQEEEQEEQESEEREPEHLAAQAANIDAMAKENPDAPVLKRMAEVAANIAHSEQPGVTALIQFLEEAAAHVSSSEDGRLPDFGEAEGRGKAKLSNVPPTHEPPVDDGHNTPVPTKQTIPGEGMQTSETPNNPPEQHGAQKANENDADKAMRGEKNPTEDGKPNTGGRTPPTRP